MKNIVTVNTEFPSLEDFVDYKSGKALLDYDIIVFDPELPYESRIDFSGGGSCISIEGTKRITLAISHWAKELKDALQAGKTIFFLLNEHQTESGAESYTTGVRNSRTYSTGPIDSYSVLPINVKVRNAKGTFLKITDPQFKGLHSAIKDIAEYKVIFTSTIGQKIFTTKDGSAVVSTIVKFAEHTGHIIFLPYFSFAEMTKYDEQSDEELWTSEANELSNKIVSQLLEIDRLLKLSTQETPKPFWTNSLRFPKLIEKLNDNIQKFENEMAFLENLKNREITERNLVLKYTALLYENGRRLEESIEDALKLLDYKVENYRDGHLEIDHIVIGPSGVRMIGESEGKDNSAINISKFRQLESNINEDFERPEITKPAKGLLFGNGYRLTEPDKRSDQFTEKCLANAKRLGTALIKTVDLYDISMHLIDNPNDDIFKKNCRNAIENTIGRVVEFPIPTL